jgi:ADP-sugar diphosphatase
MVLRLIKTSCAFKIHRLPILTLIHHQPGKASSKPNQFIRLNQIRTMASFVLPNSEPPCPVTLPENLTEEKVMAFKPFARWLSTLQKSLSSQTHPKHPFQASPYKLRSIQIQSVDLFGERIGFIKLKAEVTTNDGDWLPGAVFMRGPSVAMMVIIL